MTTLKQKYKSFDVFTMMKKNYINHVYPAYLKSLFLYNKGIETELLGYVLQKNKVKQHSFLHSSSVMLIGANPLIPIRCSNYIGEVGDTTIWHINSSRANRFWYFRPSVHISRIAGSSGNHGCVPFLSSCVYRGNRFLTAKEKAKPLPLHPPLPYRCFFGAFFVCFLLTICGLENSLTRSLLRVFKHINVKCFGNWTTYQKPFFVREVYVGKVCIFKHGYTPKGAVHCNFH